MSEVHPIGRGSLDEINRYIEWREKDRPPGTSIGYWCEVLTTRFDGEQFTWGPFPGLGDATAFMRSIATRSDLLYATIRRITGEDAEAAMVSVQTKQGHLRAAVNNTSACSLH